MHMEEFLEKEGVTGGLKGVLPPDNSSLAWGDKLWRYLTKVGNIVLCVYVCCYVMFRAFYCFTVMLCRTLPALNKCHTM